MGYARPVSTVAAALLAVALAVTGCAGPGTPAPLAQAAKLGVGTSDIADACGDAEVATAFDGNFDLEPLEGVARRGAVKLAHVYDRDQSDIYQGETIAAVVRSAVALLRRCGLPAARAPLRQALATHK